MSTTAQKRLVIDLPDEDHRALKGLAASSGTSIKFVVLDALRADLQRRRAALARPTPRPAP
jgi:hypothetical protein